MLLSLSLQQSNTIYHHFLKDTGLPILSSVTYHQCARILLFLLSLKSFPCTLLYPLTTTLVSLSFIRKKASQNYDCFFLSLNFILYLFLKFFLNQSFDFTVLPDSSYQYKTNDRHIQAQTLVFILLSLSAAFFLMNNSLIETVLQLAFRIPIFLLPFCFSQSLLFICFRLFYFRMFKCTLEFQDNFFLSS